MNIIYYNESIVYYASNVSTYSTNCIFEVLQFYYPLYSIEQNIQMMLYQSFCYYLK